MRNLIKSSLRFSWAMSLFGIQQFENMIEDLTRQDNKSTTAFDSIAEVTEGQLSGPCRYAFRTADQLQSGVVDMMFGGPATGGGQTQSPPPASPRPASPPASTGAPTPTRPSQPRSTGSVNTDIRTYPVHSGRLNTSCFIVLGEGLAAGMGDFTLADEMQTKSFPAQMAQQMQTEFPQPLIQSPGICSPVGFAELPVVVSIPMQSTVVDELPPKPVNNLSVPGFKLCDTLRLRPAQPLVQRQNAKQTAANLILGMIPIAYGEGGTLPTQLECAVKRRPTFTLVELGYYEALEAAVKAKLDLLPDANSFRSEYTQLLTSLKQACAEVFVLTIPDPFDTAYFSPINVAAKILRIEPAILLNVYKLKPDDFISANGLLEIGCQLFARTIGPLPDGCVIGAEVSDQLSRRIDELNNIVTDVAGKHGALTYDLQDLFRRVKNSGVTIGSRRLTAEYLGGFYSLNGYYPGATGHAIIANELLHYLNTTCGSDFRQIDLQAVTQNDPVAAYRQAEGQQWPSSQLAQPAPQPEQVTYGINSKTNSGDKRSPRPTHKQVASGWNPLPQPEDTPPQRLRLPPGLEQVLPVSKAASYFGDSIRAVNCSDPNEARFGSCRGQLFGGFAMVDSHVSGSVRIKFSQPANGVTHFEVTHGDGLVGEDGVLSAPQFFKLPALQNRVQDIPGMVSSGDLNLNTGEVSNLTYYVSFSNTALLALTRVNPNLPAQPIVFSSLPSTATQYGSAWAGFEQRPDGLLDYTFYGSAFLPLGSDFGGQPVQFPLPICSSDLRFASVPAKGTALHPHLSISTKETNVSAQDVCLDIPFNTIQELTLFTHNSSFGDAFTLNAVDVLGGNATGRSHVLGRALLQFGERSGNSAPVAVSFLNGGGVMAEMASSPISQAFPGRLCPGPHGFDEFLRFPLRTFSLDDLQILDDPFDISVGAVDLRTGRFLNQLLHRGFISQDLFFALIRVEPRTPGSSFFFRGPTVLEQGSTGQLIFRFQGQVHIPYPEGFLFPNPNLATGFVVGPNSALDPFLWVHAIQDVEVNKAFKQGAQHNVIASTGERFSYSYKIPSDPCVRNASFEYENHTQQGKFRMHSLAWVGFSHSDNRASGDYDTITFTGFGVWSKAGSDTVQQVVAQFCTSSQRPYIGIQIDLGNVSNVNTKPLNINDARP